MARTRLSHCSFIPLFFTVLALVAILLGWQPATLWAQNTSTDAAKKTAAPAAKKTESKKVAANPANKTAAKNDKTDQPPPSENVSLYTSDGLKLQATFFPGTKGNQSVPVILLHMWKGNRGDFANLPLFLQSQGHAVLVPDLRGHGDSVRMQSSSRPLEAEKLPRAQYLNMVDYDVETLKKFLMEKNNKGELNINKLCLVGAEMGAVVAIDWARLDWSWPPLNTGKQGQDVKAVVLLSPQWSFHGITAKQAMAHRLMLGVLSTMIVVGKDDPKAVQQAKRFEAIFLRSSPAATAEKIEDRTFFYVPLDTSLQGTKLFSVPTLKMNERIAYFIEIRLVNQNFPWSDRSQGR